MHPIEVMISEQPIRTEDTPLSIHGLRWMLFVEYVSRSHYLIRRHHRRRKVNIVLWTPNFPNCLSDEIGGAIQTKSALMQMDQRICADDLDIQYRVRLMCLVENDPIKTSGMAAMANPIAGQSRVNLKSAVIVVHTSRIGTKRN